MAKNLRCFPNPFQQLDHEGVPAATFPFDPSHSPDRRWVGAVIDRSPGTDGAPRTRPLETPGDLTAVLPRGRLKGRVLHVDRAPRKRIQFAFDLQEPAVLPPSSHYLFGIRQGSLIPADEQTARAAGVVFACPKRALATAAAAALATWERENGVPPDVASWPENLRAAAELGPTAETVPAPPQPVPAPERPVGASGSADASDTSGGGDNAPEPTDSADNTDQQIERGVA